MTSTYKCYTQKQSFKKLQYSMWWHSCLTFLQGVNYVSLSLFMYNCPLSFYFLCHMFWAVPGDIVCSILFSFSMDLFYFHFFISLCRVYLLYSQLHVIKFSHPNSSHIRIISHTNWLSADELRYILMMSWYGDDICTIYAYFVHP